MKPCPVRYCFFRSAKQDYGEQGLAYATTGSVGLDLRACFEEASLILEAGERILVPTGIAVEPLAPDMAGFVYSRSGLGGIHGLVVAQGVGVIDPDYRGEISVPLLNTSKKALTIMRGDRIAQLVFQPAYQAQLSLVEELTKTSRGDQGFGHTGVK